MNSWKHLINKLGSLKFNWQGDGMPIPGNGKGRKSAFKTQKVRPLSSLQDFRIRKFSQNYFRQLKSTNIWYFDPVVRNSGRLFHKNCFDKNFFKEKKKIGDN